MSQTVEFSFDCLPLRSITRLDVPLDAPPEMEAKIGRIREAIKKHGNHNTYYLHNAKCVFHLSNNVDVAMLEFSFEGTVLTDQKDCKTLQCDLNANLVRDTCDCVTEPVVSWFEKTICQAVRVEFDRYIEDGDLSKATERLEKIQAESNAQGGFLGMWL